MEEEKPTAERQIKEIRQELKTLNNHITEVRQEQKDIRHEIKAVKWQVDTIMTWQKLLFAAIISGAVGCIIAILV